MKSALFVMLSAVVATAAPARTPQTVNAYGLGSWTIVVRRNAFTHETRCQLRGPRIRFQRGAVGLRTRTAGGAEDAWYSVDGAAARPWRDIYSTLVDEGVPIEGGGLDDPTRGIVWLPIGEVFHATAVTVQTRGRGEHLRLDRFSLEGLGYMYAAATRLGCPADGYVD